MSIAPELSSEFKESFAAWVRLEPRCRSGDITRGLQARTADPLWMLTRQWQMGEFQGEDAGSPLQVRLEHSTQSLDAVKLGRENASLPLPAMPLEVMVEAETDALDWRSRVQIGQQFEHIVHRVLVAEGSLDAQIQLQAYRDQYALNKPANDDWLNIDSVTRRYINFMVSRVIDGKLILKHIEDNDLSLLADMTQVLLDQIVNEFNNWYENLNFKPDTQQAKAWRNQQLDYEFELNEDTDKTNLIAPDYRNGALDWYTLYANTSQLGAWEPQATEKKLPTLITVGGTSPRWWAFEDSATDFGKLDVAKPDLAKLILMEFVLIYADDWFSVPLPTKMPNLARIDDMKVLNTFGDEPTITPVRQNIIQSIIDDGGDPDDPLLRWETYALAKSTGLQQEYNEILGQLAAGNLTVAEIEQLELRIDEIRAVGDVLFIPPAAGFREESKAMEEVRFIRDEGANMVWGVENIVQNGISRPISGFDAQLERSKRYVQAEIDLLQTDLQAILDQLINAVLDDARTIELEAEVDTIRARINTLRDGSRPSTENAPRYRLASTVPENWIPFIPTSAKPYFSTGYKSVRLRRAQMLRNIDDQEPTAITAMTRLLEMKQDPLLWLEESAVSRTGLRVQLTNQRIRWVDGKTYVWKGRKVTAGKGEGSSGLRFDLSQQ